MAGPSDLKKNDLILILQYKKKSFWPSAQTLSPKNRKLQFRLKWPTLLRKNDFFWINFTKFKNSRSAGMFICFRSTTRTCRFIISRHWSLNPLGSQPCFSWHFTPGGKWSGNFANISWISATWMSQYYKKKKTNAFRKIKKTCKDCQKPLWEILVPYWRHSFVINVKMHLA